MPLETVETGIEDLNLWHWTGGRVADGTFDLAPMTISGPSFSFGVSPTFRLETGRLFIIEAEISGAPDLPIDVELLPARPGCKLAEKPVARRRVLGRDMTHLVLTYVPRDNQNLRLRFTIIARPRRRGEAIALRLAHITVRRTRFEPAPPAMATQTVLPHWGPFGRWIHGRCKASRRVNGLVSGLEFRLGREELFSLPQYMSLCPTGQCNATCDFCSVTILRTGIIKRQLPLDAIGRITSPAAQTVRMFGLEGNGEPTLYREFDRLVQLLLSNRAEAYLITNASQFDDDLLRVLLGFESINISLNAATAETHRRVMGLKNFDAIVAAIRKLMDLRGPGAQHPQVSVSFVVNRLNLHETLDFVRLAECDLGVDRIHVRPLSELANDGGTAEDFRDIVPFEGDIADVVEGMAEYLSDKATTRTAQIYFSGESFKAMRPNPLGSPVMPIDEPDRLLVPRRSGWQCLNRAVDAAWVQPAIVKLTRRSPGQGGVIFRSDPIPVPENGTYRLVFITSGETAGLAVRIVGTDGNELLSHSLQAVEPDEGPAKEYRVAFSPAGSRSACIEVLDDGAPFTAEIDFVRVRKPPPLILDNLPVPRPERWEVGVQGASVTWEGQLVRLLWSGAPGLYILKSYSQPCLPHTVVSYPAAVDVESGHLGIGVLSEDFSSWIAVSDYGPGRHHAAVRFETGTNERFQIVLYAVGEKGVAASIDWSRAMSEIPFWVPAAGKAVLPATATRPRQLTTMAIAAAEAGEVMRRAEVVQPRHPVPPSNEIDVLRPAVVEPATSGIERSPAPSSRARLGPKGGAAHAPAGPKERGSWLQRALVGKPRLYCHKPWTDLHNFTVDGRMDVCCIATGPSQERYQLGNLLTQDFQSVWNGPMAREFRRTVNNSAIALPPCRRCPMAYAYQGPYFDPVGTAWQVFRALRLYPLWRIPGFKTAHRMLFIALYGPVHIALFRGFRRPNPFPLSELKSWYKT